MLKHLQDCSTVIEYPDRTSWYKVDIVPTKIAGSTNKFQLQILYTRNCFVSFHRNFVDNYQHSCRQGFHWIPSYRLHSHSTLVVDCGANHDNSSSLHRLLLHVSHQETQPEDLQG